MRELVGDGVEERNFAKVPLTVEEISELVDAAGGVAAVLSPRNAEAKERGWTLEAPPDRETFIEAAAANNKLIRRPILIAGDRVVVGNDAEGIRAALRG